MSLDEHDISDLSHRLVINCTAPELTDGEGAEERLICSRWCDDRRASALRGNPRGGSLAARRAGAEVPGRFGLRTSVHGEPWRRPRGLQWPRVSLVSRPDDTFYKPRRMVLPCGQRLC